MENHIIDKNTLERCKNIKLEGRITSWTEEMLSDLGFSPEAFPFQVQTAIFSFFSRNIHGVGIRNKAGGVEFYSTNSLAAPITINKKSITIIPYRMNTKSDNCCIFYDFLDYLAFLTFNFDTTRRLSRMPQHCDCILLSDVSNFLSGMIETELYDNVFCFLPNTDLGKTMTLTMQQRYGTVITDLSDLYSGFDTLYNCLTFNYNINNRERCFGQ